MDVFKMSHKKTWGQIKVFAKSGEWTNVDLVMYEFLIKIKRSNRGTFTQVQTVVGGLHCRAKTHLLLAAATTTWSDVKLFEKTPAAHFVFCQELFLDTLYLGAKSYLCTYEPKQSILISDRPKKAESTFYSCHWAIRPHDLLATTIAGTSEGARGADSGAWLSHRLVLLVHIRFVVSEFTFVGHGGGRRNYAPSPLSFRSHLIYV